MLEFHCKDVGAACGAAVKGRTADELLQRITEHARDKHGVPELSQTLVNYAVKHVRGAADEPRQEGASA